LTDVESMRKWR